MIRPASLPDVSQNCGVAPRLVDWRIQSIQSICSLCRRLQSYELRAIVQRLQRDEVVEVMQKETCADCWRGGVEQAQLAHSISQYIISPDH